eukprot:gb/GECG01005199.1/.p1 GENE.gb/GECG01005199.1/~~gb/GECG01005199.1/.p1  ORF type:complete len:434 (+),score=51.76 gb/GECG01005199.1/:1-1302(+)
MAMRPLRRFGNKHLYSRVISASCTLFSGQIYRSLSWAVDSRRQYSTYFSGSSVQKTTDGASTPNTQVGSPTESCIYDTVGSHFVIALSPRIHPTDLYIYSLASNCAVTDLKEQIQNSAYPGKHLEILDSRGSPYATFVKLRTLVDAEWQLQIEDELFRSFRSSKDSIVQHYELKPSQTTLLSHFAQLIGKLENEGRSEIQDEQYIVEKNQTIPMTCHYHGSQAENNWNELALSLLENEKKICRAVSNRTFCNALVTSEELYDIIDPHNSSLVKRLQELEEELKGIEDEIRERIAVSRQVSEKAQKQLQLASYGLGSFMVGQWIFIFNTVFYQTSWDFMEPICYFIGATYAIVGYSFYMATKKEPENSKVWTQLLTARREKVYRKLFSDSTKSLGSFEEETEDLRNKAESLKLRMRLLDFRLYGSNYYKTNLAT